MSPKLCRLAALAIAAFPASLQAETIRIEMENLGYKPTTVSAHVGDTIEWFNADFLAHTATARNKAWDVSILPKKTGRVTLRQKGDIEYYCRFHPNIVGQISVAD
jgi:plastocyanin